VVDFKAILVLDLFDEFGIGVSFTKNPWVRLSHVRARTRPVRGPTHQLPPVRSQTVIELQLLELRDYYGFATRQWRRRHCVSGCPAVPFVRSPG